LTGLSYFDAMSTDALVLHAPPIVEDGAQSRPRAPVRLSEREERYRANGERVEEGGAQTEQTGARVRQKGCHFLCCERATGHNAKANGKERGRREERTAPQTELNARNRILNNKSRTAAPTLTAAHNGSRVQHARSQMSVRDSEFVSDVRIGSSDGSSSSSSSSAGARAFAFAIDPIRSDSAGYLYECNFLALE
jgi:hypothetical protein